MHVLRHTPVLMAGTQHAENMPRAGQDYPTVHANHWYIVSASCLVGAFTH